MSMYVFQVKPGMDLQVASNLRKRGYFIRCPQRTLSIRKDGAWQERTEPIFAGYLFLEYPEGKLRTKDYYDICNTDGVMQFLKYRGQAAPLTKQEEAYILWLWNRGYPITASHIYTTSNGDRMILSGMLRQYENHIISMDVRQRRAKIRIPILGREYTITLPVIGV